MMAELSGAESGPKRDRKSSPNTPRFYPRSPLSSLQALQESFRTVRIVVEPDFSAAC
jgi:hypothetical protein